MTNEFETWMMRGLVVGLLGIILTMVWKRWSSQDRREEAITKLLSDHRAEWDKAIKETENRLASSIDKISKAAEGIRDGVFGFRELVAKEYATREELREEIDRCSVDCPMRRKK